VKVGFIGIGSMGAPMAANILAAGHQLMVYDLNLSVTADLEQAGAQRSEDVVSLVRGSDVVIMSLPGPIEVDEVVVQILPSMSPGQVLIDMSTNSPEKVKQIAVKATSAGVGFLDAPVSGGVRGATKGTLSIMVGGEKELFDEFGVLFSALGKNIFYAGEVGSGNVAKLVNNSLAFSIMMANAEALVLGVKAGVDSTVLWNIVRTSSGNSLTWEGGVKAILKDRLPTAFTVDLACKDINLATKLADEVGVDLTMVPMAKQILENFQSNGFAQEDILATVKYLEERNKVMVRGTWED